MMKRVLSFLLCLIMVVSLAAPSVQASGSDDVYIDDIMDNIVIEDGANVEIVTDGNTVNTTQETKLPNPADLLTEPTTPPQIPMVTAPAVPVVPAPVVKDICECADLASAKAHGGICFAKTPYIELCKLSAQELFTMWNSYTAVEQSFMLGYLNDTFPMKHYDLQKLLNAPTGSATETYADGTTVSVEGIPQDGTLTVDKAADKVKDIVDVHVAEQEKEVTPLFGYDVSVQDGEGADWQPEVNVKMELELPGEKLHKNTKVFVVHVDDNGVATTIEAEVTEDGKIVFETPGFSAFYGFTVDFHYEDVTFSIPGMSSIKLSELFDELKVPLNASDVVALEYTDDTQLKIEQLEGDWLLTSLKAFDTEEKLTMTMADGSVYEIKVTDAEVTGGTHYWHLYNGYFQGYNHVYSQTRFPLSDNDAAGTGDNAIFNAYFDYAWDTVKSEWYKWSTADDNYDQTLYFDGPGAQTSTVILQPKTNKETLVLDMFGEWILRNGANVTIKVDPNYTGVTKNIIIRTIDPAKPIFSIVNSSLTIQGTANTKIILDFGTSDGAPANKGQGDLYPIIWENGKDNGTTTARSLNLQYVTFRNSAYSAIDLYYSQMSNVTLKNCTFESSVDNVSHGGAVRVRSEYKVALSKFEAIDCDFTGNSANNPTTRVNDKGETVYYAGRGGAIAIQRAVTTLTFTRCDFSNTNSDGHGGAICVNQDGDIGVAITTASFTGCTFTDCSAKYLNSANYLEGGRGGAVRIISSSATTLTIDDCDFDECEATSHGAAIAWQGVIGNVTVKNGSTFTGCTGGGRGGAIGVTCRSIGNISISGTTFSGNTAGTLGGAVHFGLDGAASPITAGAVSVDNCTFSDNMAHGVGGGLCLVDGKYDSISITGCTFDNCDTTGYGGGLGMKTDNEKAPFEVEGNISILGCTFQNCLAGKLAPNGYLNPYTQEGVEQLDHDGDATTATVDRLNGASGAGGIIIGGTIKGKVEISGTSNSNRTLFQNCLTWNNGAAICFVDGLEVEGAINATTGKKEAVILRYLNINKCFARDAGHAIQMGAVSIPQLDMTYCSVTNCGYFDNSDPNFNDPNTTTGDAASLIEIDDTWFAVQKIYDVTLDANGEPPYDAEGNIIRTENKAKTEANKTASLARWKGYSRDVLFIGADYGGTFRTVGNTACVANIDNCVFEGNRSYGSGGAIYWNANRLVYENEATLTNPKFTTALTISNTSIKDNDVDLDGGGIFCEGAVTIQSCEISGNTAARRGGGIAQNVYTNSSRQLGESGDSENTTLILEEATAGKPVKVFNNTALDGGGISIAVEKTDSYPHTVKPGTPKKEKDKPKNWNFLTNFTYKVEFKLGGTHVYSNNAIRNGGGIFYHTAYYKGSAGTDDGVSWDERQRQMDSFEKNILIDDGLIYSNNAGYGATRSNGQSGNGGGVYMNSNQVNTADTIPAGQKTGSSTVNITGGSVYDNHAVIGNGGGIFLRGKNAVCTITGGVIGATSKTANGVLVPNATSPNTANGYVNGTTPVGGNGGGIAVFGGVRLEMDGGYIVNNSCDIAGGGIAVHEGSSMLFTNGTVMNNLANIGGGISLNSAKPLDASSTDDAKKYAMFLDGGIIQGNKVIPITYTTNVYGGGVCLSDKTSMKINDGEINGNIASKDLTGSTFASNQEGGGIAVCKESTLDITGGVIKQNKAYDGGGMAVRGGSDVTVSGSMTVKDGQVDETSATGVIKKNFASHDGGGIYIGPYKGNDVNHVTMTNGWIYDNEADIGAGGGVNVSKYNGFYLRGGYIDGNTSGSNGGAIYANEAVVEVTNGVIQNNANETGGGGAIYARYTTVTISNGIIRNNMTGEGSGGGIHMRYGNLIFSGTAAAAAQLLNNKAPNGSGGGIYGTQTTKVDIDYLKAEGNSACYGGAVFLDRGTNTTIDGGVFTKNYSNQGSGLFIRAGQSIITGGEFTYNVAGVPPKNPDGTNLYKEDTSNKHGGGIVVDAYSPEVGDFWVKIQGGTISHNQAPQGGGISIRNINGANGSPYVTMTGGEITYNTATDGGGVHIHGRDRRATDDVTTFIVKGGDISYNTASGRGGGIYATNLADVQILEDAATGTHGTISHNNAASGGGVAVVYGATLKVNNGYITYNTATGSSNPTATPATTGYKNFGTIYGAGGGVFVARGKSDSQLSAFELQGNSMAIYGNTGTFAADDVFSNGEHTKLDMPLVKEMDLAGYGFKPEGWFEDYNPGDSNYNSTSATGLNMLKANGAPTSVTAGRYRSATSTQRRYAHINPNHANGNNYVRGNMDKVGATEAAYNYVNKLNAYVCMTLGIPAAADDVIVYDYAGTVTINVWENDLFMEVDDFKKTTDSEGNSIAHTYVGNSMPTDVQSKDNVYYTTAKPVTTNAFYTTFRGSNHGQVSNKQNGTITFKPEKLIHHKATSFIYTVEHNTVWYYARVRLVPANTIYFEDTMIDRNKKALVKYYTNADVKTYTDTEGDSIPYDIFADWQTEDDGTLISAQDQDRPGDAGLQSLDKNNVYGYDSNYGTNIHKFSGGQMHYVDVGRHYSEDVNNDNKCDTCGVKVTHAWDPLEGYGICAVCGKDHHCEWGTNGICKTKNCGNSKSHTCVDLQRFIGYCDICGKKMTHTVNARVTFTFAGTGCDIIGFCGGSTGILMANVYDVLSDDGKSYEGVNFDNPSPADFDRLKATYMVDTNFGGTPLPNGTDEITVLRQVPLLQIDMTKVMTQMDDPNTPNVDESRYANYGWSVYTVELYIAPSFLEREHGYWSARFGLDAIRIYDPVGVGGSRDSVAAEAYKADGEAWPVYTELRDMFIDQKALGTSTTTGVLFIDGQNDPALADYIAWGPNNEVYLHAGQSIAFKLDTTNYAQNVATVQFAARSLLEMGHITVTAKNPNQGYIVNIRNKKRLGTTDMYFKLADRENKTGAKLKYENFVMENCVITIKNDGMNPIAISNVKVTHWSKPSANGNIKMMFNSSGYIAGEALDILNAEQLSEPTVTPKYPALSYNGMICYNVFFDAKGIENLTADKLGLAVFDSYDPEGTVETAKDVIMGATQIDGLYMVATNGVNAKYLGDTQYFRAFAKKADGSFVYSKMVSYSAVDYAKNVLAKSDDVKLKQLVVAMLNYGAEAQKFFGYKTDDLMNQDLTADDQALLAGFDASSLNGVQKVDPAKVGAFASTGGFSRKSPAISFNGAFEINYFFTPANAMDSSFMLYFWSEDTYNSVTELTVENADKVVELTGTDGSYTATSDEIIARQLDQTLYVAAVYQYDGETYCSGVLPYSIAAYCQKPPAGVQALATAAAVYGCTAKQFFGE